jgi:YegS/Rv2252/BmrU family lipid kinase
MNDAADVSIKNIAIVCNPLAGTGRAIAVAQKISDKLSEGQITHSVFKENWPENFVGFTDAWIVGGDGTLNYFINQYPGIKIPLAIFNGGTGNDVHWLLYGNKNFAQQLEHVLTAAAKPIDAGRCNEKFFINGVGIGFEGAVAESVAGKKKKPGKTSFLVAILKKILFYHSKSYSIRSGEISKQGKYLMISVSNGRRAGGGFHIAPVAAPDDGLLDVTLINALSPVFRLRWLPVIEKGKHLRLSFISHFTTQKIIIESEQVLQTHLDGEIYKSKMLEIEILPAQFLFRY